MKVEVNNGGLVLVRSDSLLVYENQEVSLTFDEQFLLVFHFEEDSTKKENKIGFEEIENGIKFNLINFNNPLGMSTAQSLPFATANEKSVYISFAVYSINKSKVLHYSIYTER